MSIKKEIFLIGSLSLVVGLLFISPSLAIENYFNSRSDGFILGQLKTYRDEIYTYVPRAREIYDGHFPPSDIFSDKPGPTPLNALPSLVFASFLALSKGNITVAYLLVQFLFSAVIFILFYAVGRSLFKSKAWSMLLATAGVLTPIISNVFSFDFRNDFKILFDFTFKQFVPIVRTQIDKLRLARIDYPLLVFPVYLSAIIAFIRFWLKPRYLTAVVAALPAALLAYTYFHVWIYWTVVLAVMFVIAVLFLRKDYNLLKIWGAFFIIFGVLLLPYVINYLNFKTLPFAEEISYRYAVISGYNFGFHKNNIPDYIFYFLTAFLVLKTYFKKANKDAPDINRKGFLFIGFIISAVIVWNLQLFLGRSAIPVKWRYPISVTFYVIWASLVYDWACGLRNSLRTLRIKEVTKTIAIILSLLVFSKYIVNAISLWQYPNPETLVYYKFPNEIIDSWGWIDHNLGSEPKIISPSYVTSVYLTAYTSARPFLPRGHMSLASNFELEDRFLTVRKFFDIPPSLLRQQLEETVDLSCSSFSCFPDTGINLNKTQFQLYGEGFKKTFAQDFDSKSGLPEGKIDELLERYNNIKTGVVSNMPADYVYFGPWERQLGGRTDNLLADKNLNLIYHNSLVDIYKIINP